MKTLGYLDKKESFIVDCLGYSEEEVIIMEESEINQLIEENIEEFKNW
jgi:hypothetical protein